MTEYGLVLSSDGSKSSFEIGAWKALRELNIEISAVSGSFVGALNAALIAQGDFERAVRFWRNVFSKNLFNVNITIAEKYTDEWSKSDTKAFKKSFLRYIQGETEDLAPLKEILDVFIDEKAIRKSKVKLGFVSVSLGTLEAELITLNKIPRGKLTTYLLTAACFPQIVQVNRAKDPQFSTQYSPYKILEDFGTEKILSTDDIIVTPPELNAELCIIQSSEVMVLDLCETAEKMKKNIKLGYLDTLKLFGKSLGEVYFIENQAHSERLDYFKKRFSKPFGNHLDSLTRLLLASWTPTSETMEMHLTQILRLNGFKTEDIYLALLENLSKIMQVKKDEKYTVEKLMDAITNRLSLLITQNKAKLSDITAIKSLMLSAAELNGNTPSPEMFVESVLLLISCNPMSYKKMVPFINSFNEKTVLGIVTALYLLF